jgi:hypothetical protein
VAPQKLIWPHGRTYPRNAVIVTKRRISTPILQTPSLGLSDEKINVKKYQTAIGELLYAVQPRP